MTPFVLSATVQPKNAQKIRPYPFVFKNLVSAKRDKAVFSQPTAAKGRILLVSGNLSRDTLGQNGTKNCPSMSYPKMPKGANSPFKIDAVS